jgi:hypothetical protein
MSTNKSTNKMDLETFPNLLPKGRFTTPVNGYVTRYK